MSKANRRSKKNVEKVEKKSLASGASVQEGTVEVLYQKLGDRWFAFSLVEDEVFVGSVTPEMIESNPNRSAGKN